MITQFYLYTLANNLKRNLKKQFPFSNVNINKILCHGCNKDDKTGTHEIIQHRRVSYRSPTQKNKKRERLN